MVNIWKHEKALCNRDDKGLGHYKYVALLKYADGKFYYEDVTEFYKDFKCDEYQICHDIIAELFFKQVHCGEAYTSTSSIAGYHNMDGDGTLVFHLGEPHFLSDETIFEIFPELELY